MFYDNCTFFVIIAAQTQGYCVNISSALETVGCLY